MFLPSDEINKMRLFLAEHRNKEDAEAFESLHSFIAKTVAVDNAFPYWFPLYDIKSGILAAAYNLDSIYRDNVLQQLQHIISDCGIDLASAFQLQETDTGLRLHTVSLLHLIVQQDADGSYDFPWEVETYYFDQSKDWLIYVSHEGTITFAGEALVQAAKNIMDKKYMCK